jgi:hypothetical protein
MGSATCMWLIRGLARYLLLVDQAHLCWMRGQLVIGASTVLDYRDVLLL